MFLLRLKNFIFIDYLSEDLLEEYHLIVEICNWNCQKLPHHVNIEFCLVVLLYKCRYYLKYILCSLQRIDKCVNRISQHNSLNYSRKFSKQKFTKNFLKNDNISIFYHVMHLRIRVFHLCTHICRNDSQLMIR